VACIFGHRPIRQKHASALNVAVGTGCKVPGLKPTNHARPGHVAGKGGRMIKTRRIREKMIKDFRFSLITALFFLILPLACEGQNNYNLKSNNKTIQSDIKKAGLTGIAQPQTQQHEYVPHEVLVKFNPDVNPETVRRIQAELKLEKAREFSSPNLFLMKITDGSSVEAIIEKLKTYAEVKYAEPNYVVKATP
jgi:hypothetical protein